MKPPNFFIIGAPKSGTSALSYYLAQHPRIFMPREKEPNFWNDDYANIGLVRTLEDYLALFEDAGPQHAAVGEASVNYLASTRAVARILDFNRGARFIALLRNPVDLAYSWHSQMVFGHFEEETDFQRAWQLQEQRAAGISVPRLCLEPKVLQYKRVAMLGEQLADVLKVVPRPQITWFLFEDFTTNTGLVYRETLKFLNVPDDGRRDFPVVNENKTHGSAVLGRFVERPPELWKSGARLIRKSLGLKRIGLLQRLRNWNKVAIERPTLLPEFRAELIEAFRPDVDLLEGILGRDLSAWHTVPAATAARGEEARRA